MSRTRSTASTRCRDFDPVEDSIDLSGLGGAILVSSYQPGLASMMQATLTHDLGRNTTTISIFNGSAGAAFEIDVADHLSALTGISGIFAPLLVTFEDLGPYDGADTPVPNGYYGFDWVVPDHLDVGGDTLFVLLGDRNEGTGYDTGNIDPDERVAYTPNASHPVTITRSDGSDSIFDQVYLTAAFDELQAVTITG